MKIGRTQRILALRRASYQCQNLTYGTRCPAKATLQVHHLTYTRAGNENEADLVVLCEYHHRLAHAIPQN